MSQDFEFTPLPEEPQPADLPGPGEPPPPVSEKPGRDGFPPMAVGILLLLILSLSGAAWWWFVGRAPSAAEQRRAAVDAMTQSPPPPPPALVTATEPPPMPELPLLDSSDTVLRQWAGELSQHPQLAKWLVTDDLARRLVATVDNIARGESPRPHLAMIEPEASFSATGSDQRSLITADSYQRYDLAVEVFSSLDIAAAARLFHTLEPLLEEAHQELGDPSRDFRTTLAQAIDHLLAVDVPAQPPILEKSLLTYHYVDPALESASPASKHLLRLGPDNARKVQSKLRFLKSALDLPS